MDKKTAPPLSRQELLAQAVTDLDAFTALGYLRQRDEAPKLWELETNGAAKLPGTAAALADVYGSLWSAEPGVKEADQVAPDRRYWQGLLKQTINSSAFQALHATTEGSSLLSLVGTVEAGTTILQLVPKEDSKKLQELAKAQAEASELEGDAKDAAAEAAGLEQILAEMLASAGQPGDSGSGSGQPQPGQGKASGQPSASPSGGHGQPASSVGKLTAAQAQALADKIAVAKANAKAARELADEAVLNAEILAEALMGKPGSAEADAKLRDLKRLGIGALQKATAKVTELSETISGWGLEESELSKMAVPEAMGLLERMKRSAAFKAFARLFGRIRAIAAKKARSSTESEGRRVPRQETGRDIGRAFQSELVALAHPATRVQALTRWARGELRLRGEEAKKPLGYGPVVACEDASGSMDGEKQQWAKGVILSLAHFAALRKRAFGWVMYDYGVRIAKVYPTGRLSATEMLEVVEARAGGGTNFEAPLRRAVKMIEGNGLKKADIAFITDGDCAVSEEFLRWFLAEKKRLEFSVITVLCDAGDHVSDATVKKFSDRVERASSFTAEEAEAKVFAHL